MELLIVFDKCSSPDYGEEPEFNQKTVAEGAGFEPAVGD